MKSAAGTFPLHDAARHPKASGEKRTSYSTSRHRGFRESAPSLISESGFSFPGSELLEHLRQGLTPVVHFHLAKVAEGGNVGVVSCRLETLGRPCKDLPRILRFGPAFREMGKKVENGALGSEFTGQPFDILDQFFQHLFSLAGILLFGLDKGDVRGDQEGIQTMRVLGENFAWVLKKLADQRNRPVP